MCTCLQSSRHTSVASGDIKLAWMLYDIYMLVSVIVFWLCVLLVSFLPHAAEFDPRCPEFASKVRLQLSCDHSQQRMCVLVCKQLCDKTHNAPCLAKPSCVVMHSEYPASVMAAVFLHLEMISDHFKHCQVTATQQWSKQTHPPHTSPVQI